MSITEVFEAHRLEWVADEVGHYKCACGFYPDPFDGPDGSIHNQHRAHVAEVIEQHLAERLTHERAHTIQMVRDRAEWDPDDGDCFPGTYREWDEP